MKIAVIGSRNFRNYDLLSHYLDDIEISLIISGGASGADKLAEKYAAINSIPTEIILPDWKKYGRGAGPRRNTEIIEKVELVVAFWDGKSKGTHDSIKKAQKLGKDIRIVTDDI